MVITLLNNYHSTIYFTCYASCLGDNLHSLLKLMLKAFTVEPIALKSHQF